MVPESRQETQRSAGTDRTSAAAERPAERVLAWPRSRFGDADFDPDRDQFKDVVVLPQPVFGRLFDAGTTGYVTLSTPDADESLLAYALTFGPEHEPSGDGPPDAYLRSGLRERLGIEGGDGGREVVVEPVDAADSGPLDLVRFSTKTESTRTGECRAHPDVLDRVGVDDGDEIELYNPETGGRLLATIRAERRGMSDGEISLSTRGRKLLNADFAERAGPDETSVLHARRPVRRERADSRERSLRARLRDRLLDRAVGYNEVRLRVILGLNADEGRATARVNADTMEVLAVDDGDRVVVSSQTDRTSVRCHAIDPESHLIETDEDFEADDVRDRVILLPSTARDASDAVCDDVVRVRRDTGYVAVRQIVPSLFGFLGVFVGGVEAINLVVPPGLQTWALGVALLASLSAIWLVLWPERQRCR